MWLQPFFLHVGEIGDEDLIVLLSERAAYEIYRKWLDTLYVSQQCPSYTYCTFCMHSFNTVLLSQAKRIGYRVQSEIDMTRGICIQCCLYECNCMYQVLFDQTCICMFMYVHSVLLKIHLLSSFCPRRGASSPSSRGGGQ